MRRNLDLTSWLPLVLAEMILCGVHAEESPTYRIQRVAGPMQVNGKGDEAAWKNARSVGPFQFPWWQQGKQEQTEAKLLWDDQNLYVLFYCEDAHVSGERTERDSPVYQDDCVEV